MKGLSTRQEDDVLYFIIDRFIENNPESISEDDIDQLYDMLVDYGFGIQIEDALEYLGDNTISH